MKLQTTLFYTAKSNCHNLPGVSLKIKKILLKNYMIKTIFSQRHNKLFDWSEIEKFYMNVG